jgi:hypothetical protein
MPPFWGLCMSQHTCAQCGWCFFSVLSRFFLPRLSLLHPCNELLLDHPSRWSHLSSLWLVLSVGLITLLETFPSFFFS